MLRPRPTPGVPGRPGTGTCWKGRKSVVSASAGMPMPVSRTSKLTRAPSPRRTPKATSPWSVNFRALDNRLSSTCRRREASPWTHWGSEGSASQRNAQPGVRGRWTETAGHGAQKFGQVEGPGMQFHAPRLDA